MTVTVAIGGRPRQVVNGLYERSARLHPALHSDSSSPLDNEHRGHV